MSAISRLGDKGIHLSGSHAGSTGFISLVSSVQLKTSDGKPIALQGDMYDCSARHHNNTPNLLIPIPGQKVEYFNGKKIITAGAMSTCGATIIQGDPDTITEL